MNAVRKLAAAVNASLSGSRQLRSLLGEIECGLSQGYISCSCREDTSRLFLFFIYIYLFAAASFVIRLIGNTPAT